MKKKRHKKTIYIILIILIIVPLIVAIYNIFKPLPKGISYNGKVYNISENDIQILYDLTYHKDNKTIVEQEIFKNVFNLVDNAKKFIVIDMFLFNTDYSDKVKLINLSSELKDKLIKKKKENPDIKIYFITDEINNFYGSYESNLIRELKNNNIPVIITDLTKLRDSNPTWSGFWRTYLQWFGTSGNGWITHPLGNTEYKVTVRSFLKLLNFKANHRKTIIADINDSIESMVMSANPHDASSHHSNIGVLIKGDIWKDLLKTEKAVADFSGSNIDIEESDYETIEKNETRPIQIELLTEKKIKDSLIQEIKNTQKGEAIDIAMFYLSDRDIINELLKASDRGVEIRLILRS